MKPITPLIAALLTLTCNPATAQTVPSETEVIEPMRIANGTRFGQWAFGVSQGHVDATFGDWPRVDLPVGDCVLHQPVLSKVNGLAIADPWLDGQANGTAVVSLRVPVGASLASGAALRYPGRDLAVPLVWQSCGTETCLA